MKNLILLFIALFVACQLPTDPGKTYYGNWEHNSPRLNIYLKIYHGDSVQIIREDEITPAASALTYFRGTLTEQTQYESPLWNEPIRLFHDTYIPETRGELLFLTINHESGVEDIVVFKSGN